MLIMQNEAVFREVLVEHLLKRQSACRLRYDNQLRLLTQQY